MVSLILASALLIPGQTPKLPKKVDDEVSSYTVRVRNLSNGGFGNGVLIKRSLPQAYILTSAHIVREGDRVAIDLFPTGGEPITINEVKLEKRSDPLQQDLAVLSFFTDKEKVPAWFKLAAAAKLSTKKQFPAFSAATTKVSDPETRGETVVDVVEVNKPGAKETARFWKTKAVPERGRSGGPLFDADGRLLGICSGGDERATYYTHIDEIAAFLRDALIDFDRD